MRPRRGRPPRTTPQTTLAGKRTKRFGAGQYHFTAQKSSLGLTRTIREKNPEPAGQILFSLGLQNNAPASSNSSDLEMSISMEDPPYDLLVHSPHLPGVDQLSSQEVRGYDTDFSILSVMNFILLDRQTLIYYRQTLFKTINLFRLLSPKHQIQT